MNKSTKKPHGNLLDYAVGKQDERERQETMQRLSHLAVSVYFLSFIVWAFSMILDWEMGKNAIWLFIALAYFVHGNKKINHLADETLSETHITPQNATVMLQQARKTAWIKGILVASMIYGLIALQQPEYRLGALFFAVPTALIIAWGLYRSAKKHIQQEWAEWEN
ncbi:MAG: hypothetical protein Q4B82_05510 [Alysiella sp.]|uniref:hypothetical protein n=1 Tax=Alysiella sp. TaxID=1872483 RepID=UPI0026DA8E71|nr:hypothetical protein [Alysiella sp.]MDO4434022.1 hypothetical protein [Alysiella sp.]